MGTVKSKGLVLKKHDGGSAPPQPQVPQGPPYHGPSAQYHFVNVGVTMTHQVSFNFYQGQLVCSNVDSYYPALAELYGKGFRMITFYRIPGQAKQVGGLFNPSIQIPFQGMFCRYPEAAPTNERYQLLIEKSVIQPQMVWQGFLTSRQETVSNTHHLYQTIINHAAKGSRLICIELTGQEQQRAQSISFQHAALPAKGCDLFFEIPLHPPTETYIYNVVNQPINVTIQPGFSPKPVVNCNWMEIFRVNLSQGWKLIEIFLDEGNKSQVSGFMSHLQMNSQWYFEKPASRINDPTPIYEGAITEHIIYMRSGFASVKTETNWEPIIQNMGNSGWELACLLETPETRMSGLGKVSMKVLLFFQRKIIPDNVYHAGASAMPYPPQPAAMPYPSQPIAAGMPITEKGAMLQAPGIPGPYPPPLPPAAHPADVPSAPPTYPHASDSSFSVPPPTYNSLGIGSNQGPPPS